MINSARFNIVVSNESVIPFMEEEISAVSSTIFKTPLDFSVTEDYKSLTNIILPEYLGDFKNVLYYARSILSDSLIASDLGYFACRIYLLRFIYAIRFLSLTEVDELNSFAKKGYAYFNDFITLDYDASFELDDYYTDFVLIKTNKDEKKFDIYNKGNFKGYSLSPAGLNLLTRDTRRVLKKSFSIEPNTLLLLMSDGITFTIKDPLIFETLLVKSLLKSRDIIMYATWLKVHYQKIVDYDASFVVNMPLDSDFKLLSSKYETRLKYLDGLLYDKAILELIEENSATGYTKQKVFDEVNKALLDNLHSVCKDLAKVYLDGKYDPCLYEELIGYFYPIKEKLRKDWLNNNNTYPVVYKKGDLDLFVDSIRVKTYSNFVSLLLTKRIIDAYSDSVIDKYIGKDLLLKYIGYLGVNIVDKSRFNAFYLEYYRYERL